MSEVVAGTESAGGGRTHPVLAALIVNHGTAPLTANAVASCRECGIGRILVVDNGPAPGASDALSDLLAARGLNAVLIVSERNLGFAGGVNLGVTHLAGYPDWTHVLLLNSDGRLMPAFRDAWRAQSERNECLHFAGVRIDRAQSDDGDPVESMGMTLHRSLIASERRRSEDGPLLGPTGACAILSRQMVDTLIDAHGDLMCPEFFCYAEDTDLCVRARLLGYTPSLIRAEVPLALHAGQASSSGKGSDFVFFHGIRNTLWMQLRSVPGMSLLRCAPWILAGQCGVLVKSIADRRFRLLLRIYRETAVSLPRLLRQRRRIQRSRILSSREFHRLIAATFYDRAYVRSVLRGLFGRGRAERR